MDIHRPSENHSDPSVVPRVESPDLSPADQSNERLQVNVLYTTPEGTLRALEVAARLARNLCTRPRVLRLYAVPFALPLEKPAVPIGYLEEQIHALGEESPIEIDGRVILCREPRARLHELLPQHSLIVVGGKKRWWPTKEHRLASLLREDGHDVIFVEQE